MKIKKGDTIQVLTGKDRGRQGKVERVFLADQTVLVPGINQYKKHRKRQSETVPGEILILDRPLAISKVALICPTCKQPTRVGYRITGDEKARICRKCESIIDGAAKAVTEKTSAKSKPTVSSKSKKKV
ncbi:MAG: 50S ribosomal protein L24 [bacterium]|nr:50S ribosomal protein L24 [bacterium]